MKTTTQLTMLGGKSGFETVEAYAEGDILVTVSGKRVVVKSVEDNIHGAVFCCVNLLTGADCIVLQREVAYRSQDL